MAKKPPIQVHVQSSEFGKLLQLQAESVKELSTMKDLLEQSIKISGMEGQSKSIEKIQVEILGQLKQQTSQSRAYYKSQAEFQKEWDKEAKDIADMAKGLADVKGIGDRINDFKEKMEKGAKMVTDPAEAKKAILTKFNVGGIFDKTLARDEFVKKQKYLGSKATTKELHEDFENAHKTSKDIKKNEAHLDEIKKVTGIQDEDKLRMYSPQAATALEKRQNLSDEYGKYDRATYQHSPTPVYALNDSAGHTGDETKPTPVKIVSADVTPTTAQQNKQDDHNEKEIEGDRKSDRVTKVLEQIAENTGGKPGQTNKADAKAQPAGDGGLMGKIGKGLNSLGEGVKGLAAGVGKGIQAILQGIAAGVKAFGSMDVLKGALVMGVLGGAVWIMGKALQEFSELDWETIGKALVAVAGFGVLAAVMGTAAPLLMTGALAIGAIGLALVPFGIAMKMAGEGMNQLADGLQKLDAISGDNLLKVAEGLVAIGAAMAVFAAGQAAMGLSNLVTGFLGFVSGQKSPVDQMTQMAAAGDGLVKAGQGIKEIASGMAGFAKISPEQMKAVNDFPWLKATAFAAVGGAMRVGTGEQSVEVYNKSAKNQEGAMANQGGGNTHNQVIAPTTNNSSTTNQNIQLPIRNQEQSMNRYMHNRFSF